MSKVMVSADSLKFTLLGDRSYQVDTGNEDAVYLTLEELQGLVTDLLLELDRREALDR